MVLEKQRRRAAEKNIDVFVTGRFQQLETRGQSNLTKGRIVAPKIYAPL